MYRAKKLQLLYDDGSQYPGWYVRWTDENMLDHDQFFGHWPTKKVIGDRTARKMIREVMKWESVEAEKELIEQAINNRH